MEPDQNLNQYNPKARLFIGNLAWETTEEVLKKYCEQWGAVSYFRLMRDKGTGRPRGYAFVEYVSERDADKAYDEMHGQEFLGRKLRVGDAFQKDGR